MKNQSDCNIGDLIAYIVDFSSDLSIHNRRKKWESIFTGVNGDSPIDYKNTLLEIIHSGKPDSYFLVDVVSAYDNGKIEMETVDELVKAVGTIYSVYRDSSIELCDY